MESEAIPNLDQSGTAAALFGEQEATKTTLNRRTIMTKTNAKNLSKTVLMLLSIGALVLTAGPAFAQPEAGGSDGYAPQGRSKWGGHRGRRGKMRGKRMEKMKAMLNLSDAQVQQIKAIRSGQRAQRKQYRQQIRPLRKQLMGEQRFTTKLKVMRVLTQEQRAKLMSKRGKRGKRGKHGRRGRWAGNGQSNPQSTVY
jgi:Spy/CpxP family protein refolding chaperone